ncbi:unnamed protein product [Larinioides sclopetarius]|uniref:Uncharacterized protein n=1 Tax=Larinioides sclopetarius TaxID=280406 RepID=A0AAV2AFI7_9ARAC
MLQKENINHAVLHLFRMSLAGEQTGREKSGGGS